jgi:hypothetical protein
MTIQQTTRVQPFCGMKISFSDENFLFNHCLLLAIPLSNHDDLPSHSVLASKVSAGHSYSFPRFRLSFQDFLCFRRDRTVSFHDIPTLFSRALIKQ